MRQQEVIAKARKERQDRTEFASLVAAPTTGAITLPANARLAFRSVAGCAAGTTAATIVGATTRTITTPLLAAGASVKVDHAEAGAVITRATGFDVLLDNGLGRFVKIGGA